ncbi:hypothetical protein CPHO_08235 [Corynebacterium phocae]|uniref:Uncharacterized protein n=1 Tax=Corynebacterium phocae TaxID=161895 RepID=A0A1L7D417_9CORY|nr:hypothetical protein [Corynebacterium phocae]APT92874.1 hypothetical protein CPHO_08235 [Corynebacterium phocae]KAA8723196.1 hypothetical protein F4V58_07740 [Corynebacterium phocae]
MADIHAADIKNLPVVDINALDFELIESDYTYHEAIIVEMPDCPGVSEIGAQWDIDWDNDCKASLSVYSQDPSKIFRADSRSTQDWPILDHVFGSRAAWQQFLADRQAEALEELED